MLKLNNISYTYKSPCGNTNAICGITVEIPSGITAVIGKTGSGKSTLIEVIGGLLEPSEGSVEIDGYSDKSGEVLVGTVFQYPEYQLFAETVYDDIAYGPKNMGICGGELDKCVKNAAKTVGLDESLLKSVPFELSGGQKRLAAIAGVLAMKPKILILDEPAAGLDPEGRKRIFSILKSLIEKDADMTVIFVTHSMEDAAEYADNVMILHCGKAEAFKNASEIFSDEALLLRNELELPETAKLALRLKSYGIDIGNPIKTADAAERITAFLKGKRYD